MLPQATILRVTKESWAQIGITVQFLIVVRTLGEFFRLRHVLGTSFSAAIARADCWRRFNSCLLLLGKRDLVLLPTLQAVRLDRADGHSHSARVQNCCNWLVMSDMAMLRQLLFFRSGGDEKL